MSFKGVLLEGIMGTLFLNQMKKQAASFVQEKYRNARLALTDITPIEL